MYPSVLGLSLSKMFQIWFKSGTAQSQMLSQVWVWILFWLQFGATPSDVQVLIPSSELRSYSLRGLGDHMIWGASN